MDARAKQVAIECTRASDEERVSFPEVVAKLAAAGIERYHADLVRGEKTYYAPEGASEVVESHIPAERAAESFAPAHVEAAVRASQAQQIGYREFCRRVALAGCVGYWVSIRGRRAVYYGRSGETHVELFPAAAAP